MAPWKPQNVKILAYQALQGMMKKGVAIQRNGQACSLVYICSNTMRSAGLDCNQPCAWERLYSQWCRLLGLRETSVYVCPYKLWLQRGSHIACLTCLVQSVGLLPLHAGQGEEEVITYQIAPLSTLSTHARLIYSRIRVDILRYELWAPLINYSDVKMEKAECLHDLQTQTL